jgi:anti-anti-sigma factor
VLDRILETKTVSFKLVGEWNLSRRTELEAMLRPAEAADEVLLDLSEVTFIDASFLGVLIRLLNHMVERNPLGTIRIVAASRPVTRIFEICRLQTPFGLADPTSAALVGNTFVKSAASVSPFATA